MLNQTDVRYLKIYILVQMYLLPDICKTYFKSFIAKKHESKLKNRAISGQNIGTNADDATIKFIISPNLSADGILFRIFPSSKSNLFGNITLIFLKILKKCI